jgi:hypothetical protein
MKASRINSLVTVSLFAAVLSFTANSAFGQSSASTPALKNRAYAASPRAIEAFPWLTRTSAQPTAAMAASVPAAVTRNTAFAASPRVLESFPQLSRPVPALSKATTPEIKNAAYAASPRAQEQFPWLKRDVPSFEIAPLK